MSFIKAKRSGSIVQSRFWKISGGSRGLQFSRTAGRARRAAQHCLQLRVLAPGSLRWWHQLRLIWVWALLAMAAPLFTVSDCVHSEQRRWYGPGYGYFIDYLFIAVRKFGSSPGCIAVEGRRWQWRVVDGFQYGRGSCTGQEADMRCAQGSCTGRETDARCVRRSCTGRGADRGCARTGRECALLAQGGRPMHTADGAPAQGWELTDAAYGAPAQGRESMHPAIGAPAQGGRLHHFCPCNTGSVLIFLRVFFNRYRGDGTGDNTGLRRSVAGTTFQDTPWILPTRGYLEDVKALMVGDIYIGRGCRQRGLGPSRYGNPFKLSSHSREEAIRLFALKLREDEDLLNCLWTLSGARLLCHCRPSQACHGDAIIAQFRTLYPSSFDRNSPSSAPSSQVLNYLARLREEPPSDEGSSADEGAPPSGAVWRGSGRPMMISSGYTSREFCDGQSLASPGRWEPHARKYPENPCWSEVSTLYMGFAQRVGTTSLLMDLALGRVEKSPFQEEEVSTLKRL